MSILQGRRILLVEDELLIAVAAVEELQDHGAAVDGPHETISEALAAVQAATHLDAAVLDVNLRGEKIDPVAELLTQSGIPFVIVSGNADGSWAKKPGVVVVDKPYDPSELIAAVARVLKS